MAPLCGSARSCDRGRAPLTCLLIAAVGLRLALAGLAFSTTRSTSSFEMSDTPSYVVPATALAREAKFSAWGRPELFRPPGFPLLLVPGIASGHLHAFTITLNALLAAATALLVWHTAFSLGAGRRGAFLAAALVALEPQGIIYSCFLLSETLAAFAVALATYLLVRYHNEPSSGRIALAAVAVAGCAYVRFIAYFLPLWIGLVLLFFPPRALSSRRRRQAELALFVLLSLCCLGLWHLRNGVATGVFVFSTQLDRALYLGLGAKAMSNAQGEPYDVSKQRLLGELGPNDNPSGAPPVTLEVMRRRGLALVFHNPAPVVAQLVLNPFIVLLDPGIAGPRVLFGAPPPGLSGAVADGAGRALFAGLSGLGLGWLVVMAVLGIAGLVVLALGALGTRQLARSSPSAAALLLGIVAYFSLVSGASASVTSRFRVPIQPVLAVLAAFAAARRNGCSVVGTAAHDPAGDPVESASSPRTSPKATSRA